VDKKSVSETKMALREAQEKFDDTVKGLKESNKEKIMYDNDQKKWEKKSNAKSINYDYITNAAGKLIFNDKRRKDLITKLKTAAENLKIANKTYHEVKNSPKSKKTIPTNDIQLESIDESVDKILDKNAKTDKFNEKIDGKVSKVEHGYKSLIERVIRSVKGEAKSKEEKEARKKVHVQKANIQSKQQHIKSIEKDIENNLELLTQSNDTPFFDPDGFDDNTKLLRDELTENKDKLGNFQSALEKARQKRSNYVSTIGDKKRQIKEKIKSFVDGLKQKSKQKSGPRIFK
jgi:hypothetical protein